MVRTYKRKTNQQSWNEDSMKSAIIAYKSGESSLRKTATRYNIPLAALFRRVKRQGNITKICKKKAGTV